MKRLEFLLIGLLSGLLMFVGMEVWRTASKPAYSAPLPPPAPATVRSAAGIVAERTAIDPADVVMEEVTPDREEVRRRIRIAESGTYIREILLARDSSISRWKDRTRKPLRVWVQPAPERKGWDPMLTAIVRDAFESWAAVGIPIVFSFVVDSTDAEVRVIWIDKFSDPISGQTNWARNDRWWIVDANITLALQHHTGQPLDTTAIRAIALHEVGHLIGLDHTTDAASIMASRVRVRDISQTDRATAHLLYTLPAGPIR